MCIRRVCQQCVNFYCGFFSQLLSRIVEQNTWSLLSELMGTEKKVVFGSTCTNIKHVRGMSPVKVIWRRNLSSKIVSWKKKNVREKWERFWNMLTEKLLPHQRICKNDAFFEIHTLMCTLEWKNGMWDWITFFSNLKIGLKSTYLKTFI